MNNNNGCTKVFESLKDQLLKFRCLHKTNYYGELEIYFIKSNSSDNYMIQQLRNKGLNIDIYKKIKKMPLIDDITDVLKIVKLLEDNYQKIIFYIAITSAYPTFYMFTFHISFVFTGGILYFRRLFPDIFRLAGLDDLNVYMIVSIERIDINGNIIKYFSKNIDEYENIKFIIDGSEEFTDIYFIPTLNEWTLILEHPKVYTFLRPDEFMTKAYDNFNLLNEEQTEIVLSMLD